MPQSVNPFDKYLAPPQRSTAPPTQAPNPFDRIIATPDEEQERKMRAARMDATATTPDARAEALRLATETGLPVDVIERNIDAIRTRRADATHPYQAMQQQTPALAQWSTDPNNAAIAADDMEQLGALEWVLKAPGRAFAQQVNRLRYAELRTKGMFTTLSREEQDAMNAYKFHADKGGFVESESFFGKALTGAGRLLAQAIEPAKYAIAGGVETAVIGAGVGSVVPGVGTVSGAGTGFLYGARAGAMYGVFKSTAAQEAASTYDELLGLKDETGRPIDEGVARVAALTVGGLNGLVEQVGLEAFLKRFPGLDKISKGMGRDAMKAALKNPTVRAGFSKLAKSYAGGLSIEVATEVAQRGIAIAGEELAKTAAGPDFAKQRRSAVNVWDELVLEAAHAVPEFAFGMLPGPLLTLAQDAAKAKAAEKGVAFFNALNEGVVNSKTATRSSAAFEQLVEQAVQDGPVKEVYAPIDTWRTYWQSKGIDPAEIAAAVTGKPDALEQAELTGNVAIPTARYASQLAGTEHAAAFVNELRLGDPDAMNGREMEEKLALVEETKQAVTDQLKAEQKERADAAIVGSITEQLVESGVPRGTAATAAQQLAGLGNLAERAGLDPHAVFASYGLEVDRRAAADVAPGGDTVIGQPQQGDDETAALAGVEAPGEAAGLDAALTETEAPDRPLTIAEEAQQLQEMFARRVGEKDYRGDQEHPELATSLEEGGRGGSQFVERRSRLGQQVARVLGKTPPPLQGVPTGIRFDNATPGPANAKGERAVFIGYQEGSAGVPTMALYNVQGGESDGSTVTADALRRNGIEVPETPPLLEFYQRAIASQPALRSWFGNSAVVDEDGQPLVVYHGTTRTFPSFDTEQANPESDFGRGIYFSNNPEDVTANYAGVGPDLKQKIEMRAEQLAQELEVSHPTLGDKQRDEMAHAAASKEFVEHGGQIIPVFLKIENPAVLGGPHETQLSYEMTEDPETGDFTGDETGTLVDFVLALRNNAELMHDGKVDPVIGKLVEAGMDGQLSLSAVLDIIRKDEEFGYYTDDTGTLMSHEIVRQALEDIGFDGIIDHTVDVKFGSQRRVGKAMQGMDEDTVHYVVFQPTQVKSALFNRGTFNPIDPNILFQSAAFGGPERAMFYSRITRAVEDSKQAKASGAQWKATIKNAKAGINRDEFAVTKVEDLEDGQTYTKDEVLAYLRVNRPDVGVVVLGEEGSEEDGDLVIDEETLRERADEIFDRMVEEAEQEIDWDDLIGTATYVEEEESREVEVERQMKDEDTGELLFDDDGDPVMETVYEDEEVTVYYPAISGGYKKRSRGYGLDYRREDEIIPDADPYEDADDAERAAERYLRDIDREPYYELASEQARENVEYSDAEREAREELENEGAGERERTRTDVHYEEYVLEPEAEEESYREVFITAGRIKKPVSPRQGQTPDQIRQEIATNLYQLDYIALEEDDRHRVDIEANAAIAESKSGPGAEYKWADGHSSYKSIENPIVRLRLNVRRTLGPLLAARELNQEVMQRGIDAETQLAEISGKLGFKDIDALFAAGKVDAISVHDMERVSRLVDDRNAARVELREQGKSQENQRAQGERVLFIEEVQPPQAGQQKNMPPLFLKNWREIAFKWALRYAVEQGLNVVAWTTGKQQSDRYDLAKKVEKITYTAIDPTTPAGLTGLVKTVQIDLINNPMLVLQLDKDGIVRNIINDYGERWAELKDQPLGAVIGDELGGQIVAAEFDGVIKGNGLKVGGEGLRKLYDYDFRNVVNKLPAVKANGGKVGTVTMTVKAEYEIEEVEVEVEQAAMTAALDEAAKKEYDLPFSELGEMQQSYVRSTATLPNTKHEVRLDNKVVHTAVSRSHAMDWIASHKFIENEQPALTITPELAVAVNGGQALFQGKNQAPRGAIAISPTRNIRITLFETADLSTFLHESGHFYLEVMGDLVKHVRSLGLEGTTPQQQQLVADYETILRHLGVEHGSQIEREHHELFARSFETYLMEGKAPSLQLREAFSRMRAWLLGVYRTLRALNAPLTDDVRRVFDRMLASDEAIAQAEEAGKLNPMFLTPEQAGMSHERFALYRQDIEAASRAAREQLERRLLDDVRREQTAQWKERRAEVKLSTTQDAQRMPVYRALAAMSRGTNPDGTPLVEGETPVPVKLSKKLIVEQWGVDRLAGLPKSIYSREGGVHAGVVAEMFGYGSGDELLLAVKTAPPMRRYIEQETDRRMLVEHGSLLLDGTLHEQAQAAVADDMREHVLREELRALAKLARTVSPHEELRGAAEQRERAYERRWFEAEAKLRIAIAEGRQQGEIDALTRKVRELKAAARIGPSKIRGALPSMEALRDAARASIAGTRVRDLNANSYWSAARRASLKATELAAAQDFDGAIAAKHQELISLALYRETVRAKEDTAARVADAKKTGRPESMAKLKLAGETYHDQVAGVLDRFEFAKVPIVALERRAALWKWVQGQEAQGIAIDLPDELLDEAKRVNYQELTVAEIVGVTDGIKQLVYLARFKNRLLKAQGRRQLKAVTSKIAASIREHKSPRQVLARDRNRGTERHRMVQGVLAAHRKVASLVREMDGFIDGGPLWQAIIRPLNEAASREAEMNNAATKAFALIIERAYPKAEKRQLYARTFVPAIGQSLSKMERLMVALNWGNEGNRDRIMRAEGWSQVQVQAVLDTLTDADATFVQDVFDYIGSYWDQIAAKQERVYGLRPARVEASPFRIVGRELRGGYFPLKYDDRLSASAAGQLELEAANLAKQAAFVNATTRRGHTKARAETLDQPVRLDFGVMFEHVAQVIHDLSHHEALIDIGKVLGSKDVQTAIYETHGDIAYKTLKNTVRDVAFGDLPAVNAFEKALNHTRTGATVVGLGWSLTTSLLQPLGLANSIVRIGPKAVGRGVARLLGSPARMNATVEWVYEKSLFMKTRGLTQQRELNEIRNQVGVYSGQLSGWIDEAISKTTFNQASRQGIADSYFWLIQTMQKTVDVPTWLGAYDQAMNAGNDEDTAVAIADQAVLDSQGGGQVKDLAGVQRGGPAMKLFTNFYSYFSVVYNQAVESGKRVAHKRDAASVGRMASDYLMLFIVPATLGYAIREGLKPGDDDEPLAEALIRENLAYLTGMMVGVRELSGAVSGYYGYEGPAGARAFSSASKTIKQVSQGEVDEALLKSLNETAGILLHYPASQVWRTASGIAAIAEGKSENPLAVAMGPERK